MFRFSLMHLGLIIFILFDAKRFLVVNCDATNRASKHAVRDSYYYDAEQAGGSASSSEESASAISTDSREQPISEHVNEIRLSETFKVTCPVERLPDEYAFHAILFNRSLDNIDQPGRITARRLLDRSYIEIESTRQFDALFGAFHQITNWTDNEVIVEFAQFSDTGRYYCVYARNHHSAAADNDHNRSYLIASAPYIVYDG
jgi:hypothetical protein